MRPVSRACVRKSDFPGNLRQSGDTGAARRPAFEAAFWRTQRGEEFAQMGELGAPGAVAFCAGAVVWGRRLRVGVFHIGSGEAARADGRNTPGFPLYTAGP